MSQLFAYCIFSVVRLNWRVVESLTDKDASAHTKAESHTEACSLIPTLLCGYHIFEFTLKVKGVNEPLIQKKRGTHNNVVLSEQRAKVFFNWFLIFYPFISKSYHDLSICKQGHSPFFAINRLWCRCSSNGSHNATYESWHGMQVMDSTCVLDLQMLLHERLKETY